MVSNDEMKTTVFKPDETETQVEDRKKLVLKQDG